MVDFGFVVGPWLPLAEADASRLTARRRLGLSFVEEKYTWDSDNGLGREVVEKGREVVENGAAVKQSTI